MNIENQCSNFAVLFDLDGTLVDSEAYWQISEEKLAAKHNYRWTDADALELIGNNMDTSTSIFRRITGIEMSHEGVKQALVQGVAECYEERGIPWLPGAYEFLTELTAAHVPTAVVSASPRMLVEKVVACAPSGALSVLVCGDEPNLVPKPSGDPYRLAAQKIGVDICESVVFEDSMTGTAAGIDSGAHVVVVSNHDLSAIDQRHWDSAQSIVRIPGLAAANLEFIDELRRGVLSLPRAVQKPNV